METTTVVLLAEGAGDRFLGLDLLTRAVLTARRVGLTRMHVVGAPPLAAGVLHRVARHGVSLSVPVDSARPFADLPEAALAVVWPVTTIVAPAALRALLRDARPARAADGVLVVDTAAADWRFLRVHAGRVLSVMSDGNAASTGLALLAPGALATVRGTRHWRSALARLTALGRLRAHDRGPLFCASLESVREKGRLEREYLTHTNGGDGEGWFTRNIRRWSVPLSRILLRRTPVTPNQVTLTGLALAAASGWAFAQGSYSAGLVGAACYWFSMVLDCADGEVARGRLADSAFGAWLETVTDYLSYFLVLGGIVWGDACAQSFCRHQSAAAVAASGSLAIVGLVGYLRARVAAHNPGAFDDALAADLSTGTPVQRLSMWGRQLIKRSFLAHLIVFQALIGHLPALTEIWAIGAVAALFVLLAVSTHIATKVRVEPAFVPFPTEP